jgi:hypothetical protein
MNAQFNGTENFELVYLWYPTPGVEAVEHEVEIRQFQQLLTECESRVGFRVIGYPDLFQTLATHQGSEHGAYVDYLMERYF